MVNQNNTAFDTYFSHTQDGCVELLWLAPAAFFDIIVLCMKSDYS